MTTASVTVPACTECGNPGSLFYAMSSKPYGPSLCHDCWETATFDPGRKRGVTEVPARPAELSGETAGPERFRPPAHQVEV
jgi:hypothetical protein